MYLYQDLICDVIANRPAAGSKGRLFFSTDEKKTYYDLGTAWLDVSDAGIVISVAGRTGAVTLSESDISGLTVDLAAKASLASPALTGTPTAPTAAGGTNTTQLATTAFVESRITTLINAAPSALDTLGEIATQLASDESAAAALTTAVSLKAPLASPAFTGTPTAPTPSAADNSTKLATTAYVDSAVSSVGGGTVTSVSVAATPSWLTSTVATATSTPAITLAATSGLTANQFLATPNGSTGALALRALAAADLPTSAQSGVVGFTIDGGGSVPSTGSKGFVQCPYPGTVTGWTLIADQSGSVQITVKKASYSGFPTTSSIVASAKPALSSAQKATSTTLTGWTTSVSAGDIFEFNLDSVTTCTRLVLELQITKA